MIEKESKELIIEIWTYLAEHPKISGKEELPEELYIKIKDLRNECPFCELFFESGCTGCPLDAAGHRCASHDSCYYRWAWAKTQKKRSAAAWGIVNITKEWEV